MRKDEEWGLQSVGAILNGEEVPPELEDDPEADLPTLARENGLGEILPVSVLQEIVTNAKLQKTSATDQELLEAFLFYYKHDAFKELT